MVNIHDRVSFDKKGTLLTGKVVDIYYNDKNEVMTQVVVGKNEAYAVKMDDLKG